MEFDVVHWLASLVFIISLGFSMGYIISKIPIK